MRRESAAAATIAVSLMLAISGCAGSSNSQQEPTTPSSDYVIEDSLNAVGQTIGKRAVMRLDKGEIKAMSDKGFSALIDDETASADLDDADYLTIDFGDGTGMVFPSCTSEFFFYGKLDSEDMMAGKCITYHRDGVKWVRE